MPKLYYIQSPCDSQWFTIVKRLKLCKILSITFDKIGQLVEEPRALKSSDVLPPCGLERLARGGNCDINILWRGCKRMLTREGQKQGSWIPATTEQMSSSVAGFMALGKYCSTYLSYLWKEGTTDWISSSESTEGTNSLLMKRPVDTVISLLRRGILIVAVRAIVDDGSKREIRVLHSGTIMILLWELEPWPSESEHMTVQSHVTLSNQWYSEVSYSWSGCFKVYKPETASTMAMPQS